MWVIFPLTHINIRLQWWHIASRLWHNRNNDGRPSAMNTEMEREHREHHQLHKCSVMDQLRIFRMKVIWNLKKNVYSVEKKSWTRRISKNQKKNNKNSLFEPLELCIDTKVIQTINNFSFIFVENEKKKLNQWINFILKEKKSEDRTALMCRAVQRKGFKWSDFFFDQYFFISWNWFSSFNLIQFQHIWKWFFYQEKKITN